MNKSIRCLILLSVISSVAIPLTARAGDSTAARAKPGFWFSLTLGVAQLRGQDGLSHVSIAPHFSLDRKGTFLTASYSHSEELELLHIGPLFGPAGPEPPPLHRDDFALLIGKRTLGGPGYAAISTGIGLAAGNTVTEKIDYPPPYHIAHTTYAEDRYTRLVFPIELELVWSPTSEIGLGLRGFASLSSRNSSYGYGLTLCFGEVR